MSGNTASISSLAYLAISFGLIAEAHAETFTLDFNSLPSDQGWTYRGTPLVEVDAFRVDGSSLVQTTVGSGDSTASYRIDNIVNSRDAISLSLTARVLGYEMLTGGNVGWAFYIQLVDVTSILRLGLTDSSVVVQGERFDLEATTFHDYVFEYLANGTYEFYIDGELRKAGTVAGITGGNWISFGDSSSNENMDVEVKEFSFSVASGAAPDVEIQKTVNEQYPTRNEPVEFTVAANNVGFGAAADLVVVDKLPVEMSIPDGTAAFTSVGNYNPTTGEWVIGDLEVGIEAMLVIPAVVTEPSPSECIANLASASHPRDGNSANDQAYAVIHLNDNVHCVDLGVDFAISASPMIVVPSCNSEERYVGDARVTNSGPDTARNVVVTISQDPVIGPNLRFDDDDCATTPSAQCNLNEIGPGETVTIDVTSDPYQSHNPFTQTIAVSAATTDSDYNSSNNNPSTSGTGGGFSSCDSSGPGIPIGLPAGGCFIATAAYGSALDARLEALRNFRDRFLMTNRPGRAFVDYYYRYSPPLADFIADRDWLRAIVRGLLIPIVYTVRYPALAVLLVLGLIASAAVRRRRRRGLPASHSKHMRKLLLQGELISLRARIRRRRISGTPWTSS